MAAVSRARAARASGSACGRRATRLSLATPACRSASAAGTRLRTSFRKSEAELAQQRVQTVQARAVVHPEAQEGVEGRPCLLGIAEVLVHADRRIQRDDAEDRETFHRIPRPAHVPA